MEQNLTGRYVDKHGALDLLHSMDVFWTKRQIDWTAEPDVNGHRKWPWFLDAKGVLRIDEGFILAQFHNEQRKALLRWTQQHYKI